MMPEDGSALLNMSAALRSHSGSGPTILYRFVPQTLPPCPKEVRNMCENNKAYMFAHVLEPMNRGPRPRVPASFADWDGENMDDLQVQ
jgi:hypothetical protein